MNKLICATFDCKGVWLEEQYFVREIAICSNVYQMSCLVNCSDVSSYLQEEATLPECDKAYDFIHNTVGIDLYNDYHGKPFISRETVVKRLRKIWNDLKYSGRPVGVIGVISPEAASLCNLARIPCIRLESIGFTLAILERAAEEDSDKEHACCYHHAIEKPMRSYNCAESVSRLCWSWLQNNNQGRHLL